MFSRRIALVSIFCSLAASLKANVVLNIKDFDSGCGQPQHNCRSAFQKAFEAAAKANGGTLRLPEGTFFVDFPEVSNDVKAGKPLQPGSLISVPPHVMVEGHVDTNGNPDTIIEWKITSIPVFLFASASYSGMNNLHLRFTGTLPANFPYGDIAVLRALRYTPTFPHQGQMSGGNYEMSTFALIFDSEHCDFENLVFDSATHDNQHAFGIGFNVKGKGVVVAGGAGGISAPADGNRFSGIKLFDFVMGFLIGAQENLEVDNVLGDRRGSTLNIAPGHVIYFTPSDRFSPEGKATLIMSRNVRVTNVSEGPHTISNVHSLGTLAIKDIDGGTFEHISSQHPVGLIQTFVAVKNLVFNDLNWSTDAAICDEPADACGTPVINSLVSGPGEPPIENIRFTNIKLISKHDPISINVTGNMIAMDGITIETPPIFKKTPSQSAPGSIFGVKEASSVTIANFTYIPVLVSIDPGAKYNQPFACWGACTNVKVDVTVKWPKGVPLPPPGHHVVTSGIQFDKPGANNSIASRTDVN
jgi:hypothetical protein